MTLTHLSGMVPVRQGGRRPATVRLIGNGTVATNFLVQKEIIEVSKLHRMTKRMADEKLASLQEETNSTLGNKISTSERQRKRFNDVPDKQAFAFEMMGNTSFARSPSLRS